MIKQLYKYRRTVLPSFSEAELPAKYLQYAEAAGRAMLCSKYSLPARCTLLSSR